jgi:hypothetical protein
VGLVAALALWAVATPVSGAVSIQPEASNSPAAVSVCGLLLCAAGRPFVIRGASAFGTYAKPQKEVTLAKRAGLNTLELIEFDTRYHVLSDTMSTATWDRVDTFIALARSHGLHVILNLSEYGQALQAEGETPTTVDWGPYLNFIANRTNTADGLVYKNDPTIAMVELFGEICFPGETGSSCPVGTTGTGVEIQSFFHRTETEWHALAPTILVSSGGFSHLVKPDSPPGVSNGIPYQAIYSDPANDVCDLEVNSANDYNDAVPKVTSYCNAVGRPWFLSAWSSCYQDPGYGYYLATDGAMAAHARAMDRLALGRSPSSEVAVGTDFWNLNNTPAKAGTCDIGPQFPLTWTTVQDNG